MSLSADGLNFFQGKTLKSGKELSKGPFIDKP